MLQQSHVSVTVNVSAACGLYAAFFSLVILVLQCNWLGRVLHAWLQVREPQRLPFIRLLCLWWLHDWKLWRSVGCVSTVTSPAFSYLQRQQWTPHSPPHPPPESTRLFSRVFVPSCPGESCGKRHIGSHFRQRVALQKTQVHLISLATLYTFRFIVSACVASHFSMKHRQAFLLVCFPLNIELLLP